MIIAIIQENIEVQFIISVTKKYRIPKEIPIVFHNGSRYDYHFIIKELAKEFDGNFECLGENTEKYITFAVPIKKEIKNKNKIIEIRTK